MGKAPAVERQIGLTGEYVSLLSDNSILITEYENGASEEKGIQNKKRQAQDAPEAEASDLLHRPGERRAYAVSPRMPGKRLLPRAAGDGRHRRGIKLLAHPSPTDGAISPSANDLFF